MVHSSWPILAFPKADASSASPAEATTTGMREDSPRIEAVRVVGSWSERVCKPPIVEPELGLLRYEGSENIFSSIGEDRIAWVALPSMTVHGPTWCRGRLRSAGLRALYSPNGMTSVSYSACATTHSGLSSTLPLGGDAGQTRVPCPCCLGSQRQPCCQ